MRSRMSGRIFLPFPSLESLRKRKNPGDNSGILAASIGELTRILNKKNASRVSVISYSENHGNDNAVRRCLSNDTKWFYSIAAFDYFTTFSRHFWLPVAVNWLRSVMEPSSLRTNQSISESRGRRPFLAWVSSTCFAIS